MVCIGNNYPSGNQVKDLKVDQKLEGEDARARTHTHTERSVLKWAEGLQYAAVRNSEGIEAASDAHLAADSSLIARLSTR